MFCIQQVTTHSLFPLFYKYYILSFCLDSSLLIYLYIFHLADTYNYRINVYLNDWHIINLIVCKSFYYLTPQTVLCEGLQILFLILLFFLLVPLITFGKIHQVHQ
jgi:hypothetical protein